MKICYVDESGCDSHDPCLVMVGIIVDAKRLYRTREEFGEVFDAVQSLFQENLRELRGSKMFFGRDRWRNVDPNIRKNIVQFFCNWLVARKHNVAISAIDREKFNVHDQEEFPELEKNLWLSAGFHIALQVQKHHQSKDYNKGQTFLFFDENRETHRLSELVFSPPAWSDEFYRRDKKKSPLDQLIDSTFAVKSHHAGLVQVADIFAFLFRRYAELTEYGHDEQWSGERELVINCIKIFENRLLPKATRWPARPQCRCAQWYNSISPDCLKRVGP